VSQGCPAILIAGVSSGVGKTSLTLGIVRALARRGLRVQTFKVGPDFLDPSYLALASGRPCYNLDGWMTSREYVRQLFARATADADAAVIEGVMGLFDGASPAGLEGSSAEIALWLDAPVVLVVNAHGMARSLAAVVKGFAVLEPALRLAGVIANQSGSERHRNWLAESLSSAGLPPLMGAVPRGALPTLQGRHLGLVTADSGLLPEQTINQFADACEKYLDLDKFYVAQPPSAVSSSFRSASSSVLQQQQQDNSKTQPRAAVPHTRIGIARDAAFHFYYPDNLEMLAGLGAELVEFSPLSARCLPPDLGGLYFGGGYPELHAAALSANQTMLQDVRRHVADGKALYAECGGLMYLGQALTTPDGARVAMAGVLPIETAMLGKLKSLGYVQAEAAPGTIWSAAGSAAAVLRGHEFHYSEIASDRAAAEGWQSAYATKRRNEQAGPEGYFKGPVLASYIHIHLASCPEAARHFVELCGTQQ
jgi:cobyrinic acid a,c-diamide synthase